MYTAEVRFLGLVFLTCIFIGSLGADTVMVYTDEVNGKGAVEMSRGFLEDGIMEAFFESGHIIFNANANMKEKTKEPDGFAERFSVRLAKSGGASLLLEIQMFFNQNKDDPLPKTVSYSFYEIVSEKLLAEGDVKLKDVEDKEELESKEIVRRLGESLAADALTGL